MRTLLSSDNTDVPSRCVEVRRLLEDFAARRLGPSARGTVEAHLLTCDDCSDVLADMLMQQVDEGVLPLLTPPTIPSPAVYETYLRAREPELSWRRVVEAMSDRNASEWVAARLAEIRAGFDALVNPPGGVLRARGPEDHVLDAEVLTPTGDPSGTTVSFEVSAPPVITAERRFHFEVTTEDVTYQGRRLVCKMASSEAAPPVTFEASIVATAETGVLSARFDDEGLPVEACSLPLDSISLSIL